MIYRVKRIVSVLCLVAALFSAALLPASGYCENLRFVFLADSRSDSLTEPINTAVLNPIIAQIQTLSPPPAFVIFGGDMAYRGYTYDFGGYTFQAFKDLFAPLTGAGIPLYTAIGNHELYYDHPDNGFLLENQQQYQQVFTENPGNGPPGYERLVYSFTSPGGDAFFAVLDPYYLTEDVPSANVKLGGHIDYTQLNWLAAQAAQTQATHKFLFIHTPYYYVTGGTPDEKSAADVSFTYLWSILDNTSFDFYACGHSHLYSRKTIGSSIAPFPQPTQPLPPVLPWQNNVVQLLCGTCGAGVDTTEPTVDPSLWNISQFPDTYYFSVVDISGSTVTVNSYSYNAKTEKFGICDSFTILNYNLTWLPPLSLGGTKKGGATIPIKFTTRDGNGAFVYDDTVKVVVSEVTGTGEVSRLEGSLGHGARSMRIDDEAGQYIINFKTALGIHNYRVDVFFNDMAGNPSKQGSKTFSVR